MNCDDFNEIIDAYVDGELDESQATSAREHMAACSDCAASCEELAAILDVCRPVSADADSPPNPRAMWLRINNLIESEAKPEPPQAVEQKRRFWQLSVPQLAAALACIAIVSSLLTVVAIRNYTQVGSGDLTSRSAAEQSTFEKVLSKVGLIESVQQARDRRLREQQAAIEYWNQRVQMRRTQWDRATREAFDRNLQVIDESVNEYTVTLQQDPEDELSGEMLDSVLNDKMNLLRDFADL